jgi:sec-independent protein translocase protein TatB
MFDIGFSELLVIGIVALIVIGPERLPRVARTIGHLMGRMQRYVADVKGRHRPRDRARELRKMRDSVQQAATNIESLGAIGAEQGGDRSESGCAKCGRRAECAARRRPVSPAPASSASAQVSPAQQAAPAIEEKSK